MRAFHLAGVVDGGGQLGVRDSQDNTLPSLGQVRVQEQFQIIVNNPLTDRVDVGQGVLCSLEGKEANQADDLKLWT